MLFEIGKILPFSESEIFDMMKGLVNIKRQTEPRKLNRAELQKSASFQLSDYRNRSVGIDFILQLAVKQLVRTVFNSSGRLDFYVMTVLVVDAVGYFFADVPCVLKPGLCPLLHLISVVIKRRTEDIDINAVAVGKNFLGIDFQAHQNTCLLVKLGSSVFKADNNGVALFGKRHTVLDADRRTGKELVENQLLL